jgi:type IV pilus assembly protein PilA
VSEELLKESRRLSVMTVFSIVAALVLSVGFGVMQNSMPPGVALVLIITGVGVALVMLISAISRAVVRAVRLRRAGHLQAAVRAWSVTLVAILLFLANPALAFVQIAPPLGNIRKNSNEMSARTALHFLNEAELMYNASYPDIGYACALSALGGKPDSGAPSPEAAQLLEDDFVSSGKRDGYTFTISNCTKNKVKGKYLFTGYQITAVPDSVGKTGDRGFCTDEKGGMRFDPFGGTNCTEPIQ